MPMTIPLLAGEFKLGPDEAVDFLPRRPDQPNAFVPSHFSYLSSAFRRYLPEASYSIRRLDEKEDGDIKNNAEAQGGKSSKRQREDGESDEECLQLECEVVHSLVDGEATLGIIKTGIEPIFYDTLALVALLPASSVLEGDRNVGIENSQESYEGKIIATALKQRNVQARDGKAGILLGHLVLSSLKHPLRYLHPSLLKNGWIGFSNCNILLKPPFLPSDDVVGPTSAHPIGRAAAFAVEEFGVQQSTTTIWRDTVTKQVWESCPHHLLTAPELFGRLQFQVDLMEPALEYGQAETDDGFVDSVTVPRRRLAMYAKVKNLVLDAVESKDGMIERVSDEDDYWTRTPQRFYDDERQSKALQLDNRLETALEATRPRLDAPMREPVSTIHTQLMPFQKRALAWMVAMEKEVSSDEGALLPHWNRFTMRQAKASEAGFPDRKRNRRDRTSEAESIKSFFMDILSGALSCRRLTSRQNEPGGCLCDSMGLGKSLSTLSLIESHQRTTNYVDRSRSAYLIEKMYEDVKPFTSASTLLVIPSSLVQQWYSEIRKHLIHEEYGGSGAESSYLLRYEKGVTIPWTADDERQSIRLKAKEMFAGSTQARIVLATYEDLRVELQQSKRSRKAISPLLDIHWWRIMLDEAQLVSTSNGSAAEMVNCLWRTNGWIITSTPFSSSIRDMHGLLTFLDSDFASKKLFDEVIAIPFSSGKREGIERTHSLLKRIMWRHRKEHVENELGLPPSSMQTLLLDKTGLEKTLYEREYKKMRDIVQTAVGLGRTLTKKQQDRLLSLRKLISHPQLASGLGYGGRGAQRTTFANLFADMIFRNRGDLYNAQMEYLALLLKIAAGRKFRREEKDSRMWKGGIIKERARLAERLLKARRYAMEGATRDAALQEERARNFESEEGEQAGPDHQATQMSGPKVDTEQQQRCTSTDPEPKKFAGTQEGQKAGNEESDKAPMSAVTPAPAPVPFSLRYEEALYWFDVLLDPKSAIDTPTFAIDPERLANLFFEKKVEEASSVDLSDPRYHPIYLDAGDEEETGEGSGGDSEAILLKNRFRGNSRRSVQKVWSYHPRRKLQSLCGDISSLEEKIAKSEAEAAYLETRIGEELGEERARLIMKQGFDASEAAGNGTANGQTGQLQNKHQRCNLCFEPIDSPGILPCLHTACFSCLTDCVEKIGMGGKTPCPMCRKPFEKRDIIEVVPALMNQDESDSVNEYGIKISGVISHIRAQLQADPSLKIVIFSAWSSYLGYLSEALNSLSQPIPSVAFSGKGQSSALQRFQNDAKIKIMLVPMKMAEGAAGLTLNVASVAYLLEPSLDSALEDQALGRLNRIGQKASQTTYFRVLVQNSIEVELVEIAKRRQREKKDADVDDSRHHDHLSTAELAYLFGFNSEVERAKKKEELRMRAAAREAMAQQVRRLRVEVDDDDDDNLNFDEDGEMED